MNDCLTRDRFELLCRDDVRRAIAGNIDRRPVDVALDRRIPCAAEVATQIKYLQRARRKLPSYYAARCIIPSLAFEQSSGELCAQHRQMRGSTALDLTCGLGVDACALAQRFGRVVTVERDEVLAAVARENFRRLGVTNIEVVNDSAEHYIESCRERFDWCFADPDRRGADGRKMVLAEDCSPDVTALLPTILERVAPRFCVKLSPMFDVDEAFRIFGAFGRCSVEVVSAGDECKEVLATIDPSREPSLKAAAIGRGEFEVAAGVQSVTGLAERGFAPESYKWLIIPDVALQKARLARRCFGSQAYISSDNGFAFAAEAPAHGLPGRVFEIESVTRYEPRRLRRELKGRRVEILLRDTTLTAAAILKATGMREGGELRMAFTTVDGEIWAIRLK